MSTNNVSASLRRILEKKGLTQKELADMCGLSPTSVSHYCSGKATPRADTLARLAAKLDTTTNELLGMTATDPGDLTYAISCVKEFADDIPRSVRMQIAMAMISAEDQATNSDDSWASAVIGLPYL